ncbi:hypothetical protein SAMN05216188_115115 [Lentzea xinjiangensis]|uniref:Uncharacterized protein n=1 Tax=Lentzea xinjiangensis TaxID=402600 RepID=A0A1H9RX63_9PSEU|nr:hypothetical protein SAMN05216188_115115 [Lentzea xinjiangensis]
MNPAGGLVRGAGSPDGATGTRATVGGVESTGPGRGVEIDDIIENGRLRTTVTAVRLRLREQFRMRTSPFDQRLCQRQHLRDRRSQRVRDFRRKRLIATLANDETLFAHLFQCARQNAIVQDSVFVRPILVDGIRVDRGKNLYPTQRAVPECHQDGGYPLVPEKVLQVIQSTKDPVISLRHRASPCSLTGPPLRARSSRPAAGPSPSLPSRRSRLLSATAPSPSASPGDECRASHVTPNGRSRPP